MKLTFFGATRTVTGSKYLLQANGKNILIECGMYQGHRAEWLERNSHLPFDSNSIDALLLSHAHIDHSGIIPVLGTKPDHQEGPANTINKLIAQTAANNRIPLWNYDLVAGTVPGRGLVSDNIHMRGGGTHNYALGEAFQEGDSLEDLTALLMLDAINRGLSAAVSQ